MPVSCFYCDQTFEDFSALAVHIGSSKKGHRKGKRWAAKYLLLNKLSPNAKRKDNNRTPLTEEDKANRASLIRELSGNKKAMTTYCPKCKGNAHQPVPIEYAESPAAWRTTSGVLIMNCPRCQSLNENRRGYNQYGV